MPHRQRIAIAGPRTCCFNFFPTSPGASGGRRRASSPMRGPGWRCATIDVLAAIEKFPGVRPDPEAFIESLDPLQPRLYSISSSPKANPAGRAHGRRGALPDQRTRPARRVFNLSRGSHQARRHGSGLFAKGSQFRPAFRHERSDYHDWARNRCGAVSRFSSGACSGQSTGPQLAVLRPSAL